MWENHKISWIVSSLFIPIIFAMEGFFIQSFFENIEKDINMQHIYIFIFGAILIQSLATIWWLVMNIFRTYNKLRCQRLEEIEDILYCGTVPGKGFHFIDHYRFLYGSTKNETRCQVETKEQKSVNKEQNSKTKSNTLSAPILLLFVPLWMTFGILTNYEHTLEKIKDFNLLSIMKVYSLVVLIPFSLNLIILIYLLSRIINIDLQISFK